MKQAALTVAAVSRLPATIQPGPCPRYATVPRPFSPSAARR